MRLKEEQMQNSYALAAAIALSIGCAMVQPPLRAAAGPILPGSESAMAQPPLRIVAGSILPGSDSASGRDNTEIPRIYGQIQPAIIRTGGGGWKVLEPAKGVYDWTEFDNMLAHNTVTNFQNTGPDMAWLTNVPQPILMFVVFQPPAFYTNSQADYIAGECAFVKAVLLHAPHRIQIVEFINEPWYDWTPQCTNWQDSARFTANLATAVRATAQSIDSTVRIAGPSRAVPYDNNFFSVFAANGGFEACDIVTFHDYRMTGTGRDNAKTYTPYQNYGPNMPNLAECKANCDKWSGGKPVCVSELGLGTPENVIAYVIIAQRKGIWALCPSYWLGPATNLWECNYWDAASDQPKPNGRAFLATVRALNYTVTMPTSQSAH